MKDPLCVQQGQKSRFGSESSSTSILCVYEQVLVSESSVPLLGQCDMYQNLVSCSFIFRPGHRFR